MFVYETHQHVRTCTIIIFFYYQQLYGAVCKRVLPEREADWLILFEHRITIVLNYIRISMSFVVFVLLLRLNLLREASHSHFVYIMITIYDN